MDYERERDFFWAPWHAVRCASIATRRCSGCCLAEEIACRVFKGFGKGQATAIRMCGTTETESCLRTEVCYGRLLFYTSQSATWDQLLWALLCGENTLASCTGCLGSRPNSVRFECVSTQHVRSKGITLSLSFEPCWMLR